MSTFPGQTSLDRVRVTALVVVVATHALLIALLPEIRGIPRTAGDDTLTLVYLTLDRPVAPAIPPVAPPRPETRKRTTVAPEETKPPPASAPESDAAPSPGAITDPDAIDWSRESELAASHYAEALKEAERWASQFSLPGDAKGGAAPTPEFGWSHARIHRIEPIEGGGTVIWINDRCAIVIILVPIPMCGLGKREARGDLFDHMSDPPTLGDWKDP